jgi:exopolysaccharide biosynthesis polyprenyl glycosylphosphotransferase
LSFVGSVPVSRGLIAVFFPALLVSSVMGRYGVRKRLHHRRALGNALRRVVLVGDRAAVSNLTTHLRRSPHAGYEVVGAYVPGGSSVVFDDLDLEVLGEPDQLVSDISQQEIDAVAVSGHDLFEHESLRSLAWKLHGTGIQLLMAPDMAEIAGPRIVSRPAGGLPMLLVEEPRTGGPAQFLKALTERGAAALALLVLSPVLAAIAVAVKLTSPGPVLFRQTRVARDGNEFDMLKFRSMVDGADEQVDELIDQNDHDGVLFKIREDPRITPAGRFIRRYSLDELPQLWNVVRGDMSIVGPRPPLPSEVSQYGGDVGRRLMVKPGITGLWQVSGRSDLSWDESVRLDLYYVENWSLTLDLVIVGKTVKAVLAGSGAY